MAKHGTHSTENDAKSHPTASAHGGYLKTEYKGNIMQNNVSKHFVTGNFKQICEKTYYNRHF